MPTDAAILPRTDVHCAALPVNNGLLWVPYLPGRLRIHVQPRTSAELGRGLSGKDPHGHLPEPRSRGSAVQAASCQRPHHALYVGLRVEVRDLRLSSIQRGSEVALVRTG